MKAYKAIKEASRKSACVHGGAEVTYLKGITTKPRDRRCPLIAFETMDQALKFVSDHDVGERLIIVPCRVRKSEKTLFPFQLMTGSATSPLTLNYALSFWRKSRSKSLPRLLTYYTGSILCSQITTLE